MLDSTRPGQAAAEIRPEGTVVLLLSHEVDRAWAADAAVELSAGWAAGGRRVVLADLHLENPVLHDALEVSNLEGVADIFLYGASLARIAVPVRDGAFYFIPAGTYAPDTGEIYGHPRWRRLVAGFRDTEATLILFTPAAGADLQALAQWSEEAVVLGPPPRPTLAEELERKGIRVLAVLEPPRSEAAAPAPSEGPEESGGIEPIAGTAQAEADLDLPASHVHRLPESELELPPPTPLRRRQGRRSTAVLLWLALFIFLLATAGYLIMALRPDLLPDGWRPRRIEQEPIAGTALRAAASPDRQGELLPYSVQVKAFTSLPAALEELAIEQRRVPAHFFVSPEEIQGILYYRILSGLATDTVAAIQLRDRLVQAGTVDAEDAVGAWSLIQFTPLAFDLGEYDTRAAAQLRADSLRSRSIPTYATVVPYSDGSQRWQLYAGAYRDSASANRMREMLESTGIESRLTARTGLPVTISE